MLTVVEQLHLTEHLIALKGFPRKKAFCDAYTCCERDMFISLLGSPFSDFLLSTHFEFVPFAHATCVESENHNWLY